MTDVTDVLNVRALELERKGQYRESIEIIDQILAKNKATDQKTKGYLERAAYMCIVMKDYPTAVTY